MKSRKARELKTALQKKGLVADPSKDHHAFYYLQIDGKKQRIYTYFSHGLKEYGSPLMAQVEKQLKFKETGLAEDFFDCPLSAQEYIDMLKANKDL
jgi:hypothetical protein